MNIRRIGYLRWFLFVPWMALAVLASEDNPYHQQILPKPARFDSWSQRADFLGHNVPLKLSAETYRADTMFAQPGVELEKNATTRLRLGIYTLLEDRQGFSLRFDPDFDIDVSLPNLEKDLKVFITGGNNDDLPGTDPANREKGVQIGVSSRLIDSLPIHFKTGVKLRLPPVGFLRANWAPVYRLGEWNVLPNQSGYYETDDGFGEVSSLIFTRWLGGRKNFMFKSSSAGRWTENTQGWEWEQMFAIARILKMTDESKRGNRNLGERDMLTGIGMRYRVKGHINGSSSLDLHSLVIAYRFPFYKDWVFMHIGPQIEFNNETDWDAVPGLRIGLDMLFWGQDT